MDPSARLLKKIPLRIYYAKYTNAERSLKVSKSTYRYLSIHYNLSKRTNFESAKE